MFDKKRMLTQLLTDGKEEKGEATPSDLEAITEEIIDAVITHDVQGAMAALKAFFYACDAEPHEEGPHIEEG